MQFDPSHVPGGRDVLSAEIAARIDEVFHARRAAGFNVQFIHKDSGNLDEWSFKDRVQAERFAKELADDGIDYAFSA
ncbi:hypothetical protein G6L37_07415 [Agrobacterium rubi]|nr:hypothetical protein [Agrobacterium rubi]NTF25196.1 hypothetical protein [Agrobacterium rubi]